MAILFCDSFDACGSTAKLSQKWASVGSGWSFSSAGGKFGGGCITNSSGFSGGALAAQAGIIPTNQTMFGFWFRCSAAPASQAVLVGFSPGGPNISGTNTWSISLIINPTGTLSFGGYNLSSALVVDMTGTRNVCDGSWHWIEFFTGNSYGHSLYIDTIFQGSSSTFGTFQSNTIMNFYGIDGASISIDDVIVYGVSGAAPILSDYPVGPRQISVVRPVSDSSVQFASVSSGGSHAAMVSEASPDGDATYVEDGTAGHQDLLNFGSLTYSPSTITAAVLNVFISSASGGINNTLICQSGAAAQSNSSSVATPVGYGTRQATWSTDPNTSAAWTFSGLASAKFGYKNS